MADERRVVLILSVMDDIAEIRRLPELLANIPAAEEKRFAPLTLMPDMPEAVLTPRQAVMAEEILVPLDQSGGENRGGGSWAVSAGNPCCLRPANG